MSTCISNITCRTSKASCMWWCIPWLNSKHTHTLYLDWKSSILYMSECEMLLLSARTTLLLLAPNVSHLYSLVSCRYGWEGRQAAYNMTLVGDIGVYSPESLTHGLSGNINAYFVILPLNHVSILHAEHTITLLAQQQVYAIPPGKVAEVK